MEKKLRRSSRNRVIAGVCGGIGAYFGVDPVAVRIALVLFTLFGGAGVLIYLVCWLCMPLDIDPFA
jgi:phage shock protein C